MVCEALKGAGVESLQAKFDEMFGEKREIIEEVKAKKPRKKAVKKAGAKRKTKKKKIAVAGKISAKKNAEKKRTGGKVTSRKARPASIRRAVKQK